MKGVDFVKLLIGNKNYSSWSLRPWLVLRQFAIPFEEELLPLSGPDWKANLLAKSPTGCVPVLIDGEIVIPETLAIIEYLADIHPHKPIWPSSVPDRARARSASAEMHAGFTALRNAAPMNLRASHPGRVDVAAVQEDLRRIEHLWRTLISLSHGPFLFGSFSAADAMFAPLATRLRTYDLPMSAGVEDYVEAIHTLPAFLEWHKAAIAETAIVEQDEIDFIQGGAK